jgi:hypothetical protein
MARFRPVAVIGFLFIGLIILDVVLTVLDALVHGRWFIGENFYGLPIGTYMAAAVLLIVGVILLLFGGSKLLATIRRRFSRN